MHALYYAPLALPPTFFLSIIEVVTSQSASISAMHGVFTAVFKCLGGTLPVFPLMEICSGAGSIWGVI